MTSGDDHDVGDDEAGYLRRVYDLEAPSEVRDYYDEWAATYDAELISNGYASPARVAAALATWAGDRSQPLLDYGCGTGLSGEALAAAGFTVIDGADPSDRMLAAAEAKGVYRTLVHLDLDAPRPPFPSGSYAIVTAIGVIGPGAAPLDLFDPLVDLIEPGGLFGLSLNDHALEDPRFPAKIGEHVDGRRLTIEFEERGPHLPGLGVQSTVYVLRRAGA